MADLARLTPESVLHNIMPVFTFMGSNVFHRDDTYSFRVVQQVMSLIDKQEIALTQSTDCEQHRASHGLVA